MILKSYEKVWKLEKKIYKLVFILPAPMALKDIAYFAIGAAFVAALSSLIPPIKFIPVILRYGALPYLFMKFFSSKKLDGKNPFKYFIGYLSYTLFQKHSVERFAKTVDESVTYKLNWSCTCCNTDPRY